MSELKCFITGIKSGLGKYLHEHIGGDGLHRETVIIHAAHKYISEKLDSNWGSNIGLTFGLTQLPHKKFIFISSIDVDRDTENGKNKQASEEVVKKFAKNYLIIRPSLILGKYQRPNTVSRIKSGERFKTTLSGESEFYYVYNEEILEFIKTAIEQDLTGTLTMGLNDKVKLKELAKEGQVEFGAYLYEYKPDLVRA